MQDSVGVILTMLMIALPNCVAISFGFYLIETSIRTISKTLPTERFTENEITQEHRALKGNLQ